MDNFTTHSVKENEELTMFAAFRAGRAKKGDYSGALIVRDTGQNHQKMLAYGNYHDMIQMHIEAIKSIVKQLDPQRRVDCAKEAMTGLGSQLCSALGFPAEMVDLVVMAGITVDSNIAEECLDEETLAMMAEINSDIFEEYDESDADGDEYDDKYDDEYDDSYDSED